MTLLDTAFHWYEQGIVPIPMQEMGKVPMFPWSHWKEETPPRKLIEVWFKNNHRNIGLICGTGNLAVLDFDNLPVYFGWLSRLHAERPAWYSAVQNTFRVRTNRGMHVYFRTEQAEESRKIPEITDLRAVGCLVVTPPSIHPSGKQYQKIGADEVGFVQTLDDLFPKEKETYSGSPSGKHIETSSIVRFVSQYCEIKRSSQSGRFWKCRCPNPKHEDKVASFIIDVVSNRARCMSEKCALYHKYGVDLIDIVKVVLSVDTATAISMIQLDLL